MEKIIDRMGICRDDNITDDERYGGLYLRKRNMNNANDYGGTNEHDAAKLANIDDAAAGSTCLLTSGDLYIRGVDGTWELFGGSGGGGGGGGGVTAQEKTVRFVDYNGDVLHEYTPDQFDDLSSLPSNPTHEGLTAQGWNYTMSAAKEYVETYGALDIGQMYTTSDGKTRLYVHLEDGRLEPMIGLGVNGSVVVDWGDGSDTDTLTGSDSGSLVYKSHTYSAAGDYVISLTVTGTSSIIGTNTSSLLSKNGGTDNEQKAYATSLMRVEIGDNITIADHAFNGCLSLTSVSIPVGMASICSFAFNQCYSLKSVVIPANITAVNSSAFAYCYSLKYVAIPATVTSIGEYAFMQCFSLTRATLPYGITTISSRAFSTCCSLTSIYIPEGVTNIGPYAFQYCYSLTSIDIPEGVTDIGTYAFQKCSSLTQVKLPRSMETIGGNAFQNCNSLSDITIHNGMTNIGTNAFQNCSTLQSINIPDSVTMLGNSAFENCASLVSISIPLSITRINANVFAGDTSLKRVTISPSVTSIYNGAFTNCHSLTSIVIPAGVYSIAYSAFSNCCGLGSIKFESQTPATVTNASAWSNLPTDCIIYVPQGSLSAYTSAENYPSSSTYQYVEY